MTYYYALQFLYQICDANPNSRYVLTRHTIIPYLNPTTDFSTIYCVNCVVLRFVSRPIV